MRHKAAAVGLTLAMLFLVAGDSSGRIPRPSVTEENWQLEFEFKALEPIQLEVAGERRTYWYLRYTVINRTGDDRPFTPDFTLYSERGELHQAGFQVPHQAYEIIRKRHNDPLLRTPVGMMGKLLQGEDNAKHGIAIWPDFDAESGFVDIFVGGLSGEVQEIPLPKPIKKTLRLPDGKTKEITKRTLILSKTLNLRFKIAGEVAARHRAEPELVFGKWVMR